MIFRNVAVVCANPLVDETAAFEGREEWTDENTFGGEERYVYQMHDKVER